MRTGAVVRVGGLALLVGAGVGTVGYAIVAGLDAADKLASVVGAVTALVALGLTVWALRRRGDRDGPGAASFTVNSRDVGSVNQASHIDTLIVGEPRRPDV